MSTSIKTNRKSNKVKSAVLRARAPKPLVNEFNTFADTTGLSAAHWLRVAVSEFMANRRKVIAA